MIFRVLILIGLLAGLLCFAAYAWTGQIVWRHRGLLIIKWTVGIALAFFAVLFVQRLVEMM
ncbi:hypothetical protein [Piscinibacter sakaiensis]|uniref:hypothetical protein n=1 Tax=Piscinibacter sakaiensis TaxID=1547922 RepID=UPI003AAF8C90